MSQRNEEIEAKFRVKFCIKPRGHSSSIAGDQKSIFIEAETLRRNENCEINSVRAEWRIDKPKAWPHQVCGANRESQASKHK
jgi:hypothetical protein